MLSNLFSYFYSEPPMIEKMAVYSTYKSQVLNNKLIEIENFITNHQTDLDFANPDTADYLKQIINHIEQNINDPFIGEKMQLRQSLGNIQKIARERFEMFESPDIIVAAELSPEVVEAEPAPPDAFVEATPEVPLLAEVRYFHQLKAGEISYAQFESKVIKWENLIIFQTEIRSLANLYYKTSNLGLGDVYSNLEEQNFFNPPFTITELIDNKMLKLDQINSYSDLIDKNTNSKVRWEDIKKILSSNPNKYANQINKLKECFLNSNYVTMSKYAKEAPFLGIHDLSEKLSQKFQSDLRSLKYKNSTFADIRRELGNDVFEKGLLKNDDPIVQLAAFNTLALNHNASSMLSYVPNEVSELVKETKRQIDEIENEHNNNIAALDAKKEADTHPFFFSSGYLYDVYRREREQKISTVADHYQQQMTLLRNKLFY